MMNSNADKPLGAGARRRTRPAFCRVPGRRWGRQALALLAGLGVAAAAGGAELSDPEVDAYNVRVGTQTFAGLYQFTTNTLLVETAEAIQGMGSDTIKMYLGSNFPRQYRETLPPTVTSLVGLARDVPSCRRALDMPFRHVIAWAYPFSNSDAPFLSGGYTATEQANDYREMYDLTRYLLTNYNNSGKTFYLGHWEGDGYLDVVVNGVHWGTNPSPAVVAGMIAWESNRQKAVDDAKSATARTNVNVYYYAEVNRVHDAMYNGATNNVRVINAVVPYVTNLDFVSYSSYDAMNYDTATVYGMLDYVEGKLPPVPAGKAGALPAERLWIGEYGWGGYTTADQEPVSRAYIQRLLNYGRKAMPFILFWEIYNNETNPDGSMKNFCLIDSNNVKVASYYLHERFINRARLAVAQFKESFGRLPTDSEFVARVSPLLDRPLPPATNLVVANVDVAVLTNSSAEVSGQLTQGVYGDEQAAVRVFWGRQDGGTLRAGWEQSRWLGVNTNFNPAIFTTTLTNLTDKGTWYFRFYATNGSGEVWAPVSGRFEVPALNAADFGVRMKVTFAGYNRGEVLTDFPALVNLGTNLPGFSYNQFASPTGGDLRFTDATGTRTLASEIDTWNTNGVSSVWVKVPQLSGPEDYVWAYWGNAAATNSLASSSDGSVWAPDHTLVWHLRETGFPFADSALHYSAMPGVAPVSTSGLVGRGSAFNGTTHYLNAGVADLGDAFTLSAWVKVDPSATDIQSVWANKATGWNSAGFGLFVNSFSTTDGRVVLETGNGSGGVSARTIANVVPRGQWHRLTAAVDKLAGTARLYVDGVDRTESGYGSVTADLPTRSALNMGRFTNGGSFHFRGVIDEARIENRARSSNWIWASWLNVVSNAVLASYSPVTRTRPALAISATNDGFTLSWPGSAVGFGLFSTTNLSSPGPAWSLVTNQPILAGTQWQVALPPDTTTDRFFRLQAPN